MAHHKSAKKRIRQTLRRTEVTRARRSRVRTFIKKVELAIAEGNAKQAEADLRVAQSEMARAASKGVFKSSTMARKVGRLSAGIKTLKQAA
jgi:small subunit ribosomal protein S20